MNIHVAKVSTKQKCGLQKVFKHIVNSTKSRTSIVRSFEIIKWLKVKRREELRVELPLTNHSMKRRYNSLNNKTWHHSIVGIQINQMSHTKIIEQQNMDVHQRWKLEILKLEYLQSFPKIFKNRL